VWRLAQAVRAEPALRAVVVVPNLQNPLGALMPDAAKRRCCSWPRRTTWP
jgi:DNA-binding transcriptional MocR family regulator